jgi:hypothetical protein
LSIYNDLPSRAPAVISWFGSFEFVVVYTYLLRIDMDMESIIPSCLDSALRAWRVCVYKHEREIDKHGRVPRAFAQHTHSVRRVQVPFIISSPFIVLSSFFSSPLF